MRWSIFRVLIPGGPAMAEEARKLRELFWGRKTKAKDVHSESNPDANASSDGVVEDRKTPPRLP